MTKEKEFERCWVHKDFKKKIKQAAVNNDMTVIEYTKKIGEEPDPFEEVFQKPKKKRGYDFGF